MINLKSFLNRVENLINKDMIDDELQVYIDYLKYIEANTIEGTVKAEFYASFGYFLFNLQAYDECLNMFMEAQNYGYALNEVKGFIFEGFIQPNLKEFEENYNENIKIVGDKLHAKEVIGFENLRFYLIPTMNDSIYYIFDKISNKIIERVEYNGTPSVKYKIKDDFSDFLIVENYDWRKIKDVIDIIKEKNRRVYIVVSDIERFQSVFQGMLIEEETYENIVIFNGLEEMNKYFEETDEYIPRNIIDCTDNISIIEKVIDNIHKYRISRNGRKGSNVLLSICIPSYNRGDKAYNNVINTLKSCYDEEIEVIISDNGSNNDTNEYYDKIKQINDSRVKYFRFDENQGFAKNLCKVCEIAVGNFILLLSDEDFIDVSNIFKIMDIMRSKKDEISIIRTSGTIQAGPPLTTLKKAGKDAMLGYMLSSNYMSGVIFNRNILNKYKCREYIINNLDNVTCSYYPHMVWELILCQYGDAIGLSDIVILEGKAEKREDKSIYSYATIESRIEQHIGFFKVMEQLEICRSDFNIFRQMYINLCSKTMILVTLSIDVYYSNSETNLINLIDSAYDICLKCLDTLYLKDKGKLYYYESDKQIINTVYEDYKRSISTKYSRYTSKRCVEKQLIV
ncbi:glycosyltransferase family 2 protein [Clostridium gasigenes]|uniref:glycosyltransferase n=1 Tax=Clostridium gasigenes TaxID=94869 RepID=UPI00162816B4|nr:glycosyltransferase family 2 protein [Clostridium gasigenes]MBB6625567.1 glycosyltransferase family 2 protein [Clostridium gasigenes]MBU3089329.1 glycosyltransferase family 2 protein [Clostridium gasigenes]